MLLAAEPNAAHLALAELERRGLVHAVVTQNIDPLHERAGSGEVIEVHGSIRRAVCLRCAAPRSCSTPCSRSSSERRAPLCPACGAVLKPDVVLFGELLPAPAIDRATERWRARRASLLVVGSSLEVWPVAGLPLEARCVRDRQPRPDGARRAVPRSWSTAARARRLTRSSRSCG